MKTLEKATKTGNKCDLAEEYALIEMKQPIRKLFCCYFFFASFLGLINIVNWLVRHWVSGMIFRGVDVYWLPLPAHLVSMGLIIVPTVLIVRLFRSQYAFQVGLFTLIALTCWELLMLIPNFKIHDFAFILLACGIATCVMRLIRARSKLLSLIINPRVMMSSVLLYTVVAGTAFFSVRETRHATKTTNEFENPPNVILIVLDTVRADVLTVYNPSKDTSPNLNIFAKRSVTFENAYSTSPWTLPSHASLFTGQWPNRLGRNRHGPNWVRPLERSWQTLSEVLNQHGYETSGFVANTRYCSSETGLSRGFSYYDDYTLDNSLVNCTKMGNKLYSRLFNRIGVEIKQRKDAEYINESFLKWLDSRQKDKPYFTFLNYFDAHDPYLVPDHSVQKHLTERELYLIQKWWVTKKNTLTDEDIEMVEQAHEDCIRYLDTHLGKLLQELRTRNELKNTIVIITADHGEHFADHGLFGHGNSLYQSVIHVPLMISWKDRIPENRRVNVSASIVDIPATIFGLLGIKEKIGGESLVPQWEDKPISRSIIAEVNGAPPHPPSDGHSPACRGSMQAIILNQMKFIQNEDGTEELFDLKNDKLELNNLIDKPEFQQKLLKLRNQFQRILQD